MTATESSSGATDTGRGEIDVSISIRTILLVAGAVAIGGALASIRSVLLVIFVSIFSVAVLSPLVTGMERRLGWSRGLCSTLLVLGIMIVIGAVVLVMVQAIERRSARLQRRPAADRRQGQAQRSGQLPQGGGSGSLDTLRKHTGEITQGGGQGVGRVVVDVGISGLRSNHALLLGDLPDALRADRRAEMAEMDRRPDASQQGERYLRVTDRIINTTSRYMLGNLAISVVCGTVYGVTALILGLPYPLALALIAAILDLVPNIGATIAGILIGIVALSVSLEALIVFVIVIVVYQQIENYILQPTIIGKAAQVSGFTVLASVLVFGALFGFIGAIIGVPIAAALQIVVEELTAGRRACIAAADAADQQQPAQRSLRVGLNHAEWVMTAPARGREA